MKVKTVYGKSLLIIILVLATLCVFLLVVIFKGKKPVWQSPFITATEIPVSFRTGIVKSTFGNDNFRRVLFTGSRSQLVVMSIPPEGEAGEETHKDTEQTLFFLSGSAEATLNNKPFLVGPGDVVVVTPGTRHNFRNTGSGSLKLYTVYSPPNHIDGRIHKTKADADADTADEAFGESEGVK